MLATSKSNESTYTAISPQMKFLFECFPKCVYTAKKQHLQLHSKHKSIENIYVSDEDTRNSIIFKLIAFIAPNMLHCQTRDRDYFNYLWNGLNKYCGKTIAISDWEIICLFYSSGFNEQSCKRFIADGMPIDRIHHKYELLKQMNEL